MEGESQSSNLWNCDRHPLKYKRFNRCIFCAQVDSSNWLWKAVDSKASRHIVFADTYFGSDQPGYVTWLITLNLGS